MLISHLLAGRRKGGEIEILEDHVLTVANDGLIESVEPACDAIEKLATASSSGCLTTLTTTQFLMPGMIDCHIHAPQYSNAGTGLDLPLMKWLNCYTFPSETRFKETEKARQLYMPVVRRTLHNGTTTAMYFATIHLPATMILVDVCRELGQRALIGKVAMDQH